MISAGPLKVTSRRNPQFQQWQSYIAHPEDPECPWIGVEGIKPIRDLSAGRPIELLISSPAGGVPQEIAARARRQIEVPDALFRHLSQVRTPQGLLAFFEKPQWEWSHMTPCILFLDRIQDPGNLGTLLRTALATGLFSVLCSPGTVSCFNAKVVRATAAALFAVPFLQDVEPEEPARRGYRCWGATAGHGPSLFEAEFRKPLALYIGNEGDGLSAASRTVSRPVHIPMSDASESLNAAVAGSLLLYEVFRRKESA